MSEALFIFLRYPQAGKAKTRLIPELGRAGAARFYRLMTEHVCREMKSISNDTRRILAYFTPEQFAPQIQSWLGENFPLKAQPSGDLGQRLDYAFDAAFDSGDSRVVAVGTDCVSLDGATVIKAFEALKTSDAVVGPAEDGGYYLIGLSRRVPGLFEDIPWSSDSTLNATKRRLIESNATFEELHSLSDIDEPRDLLNLPADWREIAASCSGAESVWD